MSYAIGRRQTTFWDLHDDRGVVRVHFVGKEEFCFVEPLVPSFAVMQEHAVLTDYHFAWESIYLSSAVPAYEQVFSELTQVIEAQVEGWRSASCYFNSFGAGRILREGHGHLVSAPLPITEACRTILNSSEVRFSCLPERPCRRPRQALVAGRNFVVAESFRVEIVT